jgi:hypothetical protein
MMASCLIFDDAFLSTLDGQGAAFERGRIARTAKLPAAKDFRDRLEAAVADYPVKQRPALIGRIRSLADIESLSAISECFVYAHLRCEFGKVEVERPFASVQGKTPDFFVPDLNLAVEVASLFDSPDPNYTAVIETINTLRSTSKVVMFRARHLPRDENPRLSEVKAALSPILDDYDGTTPFEWFSCRTPQGIELSGALIKGKIEHAVVGGTYDSQGSSAGQSGYNASIRQGVLKDKVKKYRGLATAGTKLLLVLYSQNNWLDEDDFDEILFGEEEYVEDEKSQFRSHRRQAFITPNHNRALSGVIIYSGLFREKWLIVPNQYATVPLAEAVAPLQRAFGAMQVGTPSELLTGRDKGPVE